VCELAFLSVAETVLALTGESDESSFHTASGDPSESKSDEAEQA